MKVEFEMSCGLVENKSRCAVVYGTILVSKTLGQLFIATVDQKELKKACARIMPKSFEYSDKFEHEYVLFPRKSVEVGDEARKPIPETAWEKMDTAPKDGREVLLLVERRAGVPYKTLVGHYMQGGHCIDDHPPISEGWYFWDGRMFDKAAEPVLWMPLPDIPKKYDTSSVRYYD